MATATDAGVLGELPAGAGGPRLSRKKLLPDGVFAMLVFIFTEVMFFSGLISGLTIARSNATNGVWPPVGQPRLPAAETAVNTIALLLSGVALYIAHRRFSQEPSSARWPLLSAILLGVFFVGFQGAEWVALLGEGLTMTSSTHGSFFYLIIGTHGLHAVLAIACLVGVWISLLRGKLKPTVLWTVEAFWYFVVAIWPFLYWRVYL